MNKSDEKTKKLGLTCIVENNLSDVFIHIMQQPPIFSNILRFLTFDEISSLREAVKHCHKALTLHFLLLMDGLLKIIPYELSVVKGTRPVLSMIKEWKTYHYPDTVGKTSDALEEEFKILRLICYNNEVTEEGADIFEPGAIFEPPPTIRSICAMAGELDDNTVFYLGFKHCLPDEAEGLMIYAPTYRGLIKHLFRLNVMDDFVKGLNTSRELSNALKNAGPQKASVLLKDALGLKDD